ncbi:MAG: DUF1178 family protein [Sulfitobacter sp.]
MIRYALKCEKGHSFDSWFASATAFETLERAGHLSCAVCGSGEVAKSLMAPRVTTSEKEPAVQPQDTVPMLSHPKSDVEKAVAALRKKVEESSEYVGKDFVAQARAMHDGDTPERSIYGEARLDQARALVEEGVPILPLPFRPKKKLS